MCKAQIDVDVVLMLEATLYGKSHRLLHHASVRDL
jgi:hypothetical protein